MYPYLTYVRHKTERNINSICFMNLRYRQTNIVYKKCTHWSNVDKTCWLMVVFPLIYADCLDNTC